MILGLMFKGLLHGKARFACAVAGVAISCGTVVFTASLVRTNHAQAPELARRATAPWTAWQVDGVRMRGRGRPPAPAATRRQRRHHGDLELDLVQLTIDYRPGGRVLQGPPMAALMARAPSGSPYGAVSLEEGRWPDDTAPVCEVACTRSTMRRFGRGKEPPLGETVKFVGSSGTMTARIVGYLGAAKLPFGWPSVFANETSFKALDNEPHGRLALWRNPPPFEAVTAASDEVIAAFKGDEQRRMDYATPLMMVAAVLAALSLLVNSLLLSVESNRSTLAMLRTVGMTRMGTVGFVLAEALFSGLVGWVLGVALAAASLAVYVACDPVAFPVGASFDHARALLALGVLVPVVLLAVLFALRPALQVRAADAAARRPRSRRHGMAVTFACGFAAFVAVEVWGASLMRGFIPSTEWPDAIVSILPGGASSFDVEKLRKIEGVKRISELYPLQLDIVSDAAEARKEKLPHDAPPGMRMDPNALFLASEWLPRFKFIEGRWEDADKAISSSDAVVISEMMSRAHGLHRGDHLRVSLATPRDRAAGRKGQVAELPIAGVVDVNWHMVTSRGLVRGLNGASGMTDGPVFCSFDTVESLDPRPAFMVKMTHLWVEYEPEFLSRHGVFPAGRLVEKSIAKALGLLGEGTDGATVRLHARDEIADGTLAHGSDVIGQAARVPFVFLFVLAIGFVAMLTAEAESKRHELTVLRTVGATRMQLAWRLAATALRTSLWGIACGVPIGALVGWLFSLGTGNWPGMPHYFVLPLQVTIEGAIGAVVFALVFSIPASISLARKNV